MSHDRADLETEVSNFVSTIVVAGGSGLRFGQRKQFAALAGRSVLEHTLNTVAAVSDAVVVVVPEDVVVATQQSLDVHEIAVVAGGATRADSVRSGLVAVPLETTVVLVHDAARPLASRELFDRVISGIANGADAVIPVVDVTDSIRHVDGHAVDRSELRAVQTPQGFAPDALRAAHESGQDASDDATLVSALGCVVQTVVGDPVNRKLTVPSDLIVAEALLSAREIASSAPKETVDDDT